MSQPLDYGEGVVGRRRQQYRRYAALAFAVAAAASAVPYAARKVDEFHLRRKWSRTAALIQSVEAGDTVAVRSLLRSGADVNTIAYGRSLLATAAERRDRPMVDLLLSLGAAVNAGGVCPLVFAVGDGDRPLVDLLLAKGADVDGPAGLDRVLHVAVRRAKPAYVRLLLERGAKPDARGDHGERPLHFAVEFGRAEALGLLLAGGANPDATDDAGATPLSLAAWRNEAGMAAVLLAHGGRPTVWSAAAFGDLPAVERFVRADPGLVAADARSDGEAEGSLLYLSALNGRRAVFDYLVSAGADPAARCGRGGGTALHAAASGGDVEIVGQLLARGLDVNVADGDGGTPLHEAAWSGRVDVARLLIDRGANLQATEGDRTPLARAVDYGQVELARLLLDRGATLQPAVLFEAAKIGDVGMVSLLVGRGADTSARDSTGRTAFQIATDEGKRDVADYLARHGGGPATAGRTAVRVR